MPSLRLGCIHRKPRVRVDSHVRLTRAVDLAPHASRRSVLRYEEGVRELGIPFSPSQLQAAGTLTFRIESVERSSEAFGISTGFEILVEKYLLKFQS